MATDKPYKITISTDFEQSRRYDFFIGCALCNRAGEQIGFARLEDLADSEAVDNPSPHSASLEVEECDHLHMFIYLHTAILPAVESVAKCRPFEISIEILHLGKTLLSQSYNVDQWGGCSIEIDTSRL